MSEEFDVRDAVNAISDVVQNRPRPLRHVDQIYMKSGDMVHQTNKIAKWSNGKRLAFIGDGDGISICIALLKQRQIINHGPASITVFDFDERICNAVTRFADHERLTTVKSQLYNCLDQFPEPGAFDCFYTNPPWGASNAGASVKVFVERGFEAVGYQGEGVVVIADNQEFDWPQKVLHETQKFAIENQFFVSRLQPALHSYHLDDTPELKSCNLMLKALPDADRRTDSASITDPDRLKNFYGRENIAISRYIRENKRVDYGKAHDDEYFLQSFAENTP